MFGHRDSVFDINDFESYEMLLSRIDGCTRGNRFSYCAIIHGVHYVEHVVNCETAFLVQRSNKQQNGLNYLFFISSSRL